MASHTGEAITASMKRAAAVLRDAGIPFALGGGLACWAYGAPQSQHDVDFMVRPEDARAAQQALAQAGFRPEDPPEDWLLKVYDGDVLIDLIFRPANMPITQEMLDRAELRDVMAMRMKVLRLEDVVSSQLLALHDHLVNYTGLLATARSVREKIDWDEVRARTMHSPYARAFFALLAELDVLPVAAAVPLPAARAVS